MINELIMIIKMVMIMIIMVIIFMTTVMIFRYDIDDGNYNVANDFYTLNVIFHFFYHTL